MLAPKRKQIHANSEVLTFHGDLGTHVTVPLPVPFSTGHYPPDGDPMGHGFLSYSFSCDLHDLSCGTKVQYPLTGSLLAGNERMSSL